MVINLTTACTQIQELQTYRTTSMVYEVRVMRKCGEYLRVPTWSLKTLQVLFRPWVLENMLDILIKTFHKCGYLVDIAM